MSNKSQYITFSILDFLLTFGGSATIIVFNFISENSMKYKLTLSGIVLVIALIFTAKAIFEKHYRDKLDSYLQQLARSTDERVKEAISTKIDKLKMEQNVYSRLIIILPFAIIYVITYLGQIELEKLNGCVGFIILSLAGGGVFNIIKKPAYEKWQLDKITKSVK